LNTLRPAFTLIEILVSVLILSTSIIYVLQIHSQNHEQAIYISKRNKHALEDSLFLDRNIISYHKEKKSAYDLLQNKLKVDTFRSRKILKELKRDIFIPEKTNLAPYEEMESGPTAIISEIKLKGDYASSYFHFQIESF